MVTLGELALRWMDRVIIREDIRRKFEACKRKHDFLLKKARKYRIVDRGPAGTVLTLKKDIDKGCSMTMVYIERLWGCEIDVENWQCEDSPSKLEKYACTEYEIFVYIINILNDFWRPYKLDRITPEIAAREQEEQLERQRDMEILFGRSN